MSGPTREALAGALERAARFLEARAGKPEALYGAALAGAALPAAFLEAAAARQDARGALGPLLAGDAPGPGVASSADALGWLGALGAREGAVVDRAVGFLLREQREDGGWSDPAAPDDEARLALTAAVAGHQARCPAARPTALRRAAAHLAARWSRERVQRGSYAAIAGTLHAFAGVPAEVDVADEALQWCGRELERGFRTGAFAPLAVAGAFLLCGAAALPGARLGAAEVAEALLREQAADGGFGADPERERSTCRAAAALRHLGACLR
jgi:hypothetical protein